MLIPFIRVREYVKYLIVILHQPFFQIIREDNF